jgi:hypothetical protein
VPLEAAWFGRGEDLLLDAEVGIVLHKINSGEIFEEHFRKSRSRAPCVLISTAQNTETESCRQKLNATISHQ